MLSFSYVKAMVGDHGATFLVAGVPQVFSDPENRTTFKNFLMDIDKDAEIKIHADAYRYGEGESLIATPEEIAYFMNRMWMNSSFLAWSCEFVKSKNFTIHSSPSELFGQILKT